MKTKEELNALKEEEEMLNKKLAELSEEELKQVAGGASGCVDSLRATLAMDSAFAPPTLEEAQIEPLNVPASIKIKDDSAFK